MAISTPWWMRRSCAAASRCSTSAAGPGTARWHWRRAPGGWWGSTSPTRCSPRRGAAEDLPYAEASFDVVTSRVSAHHYARPRRAVQEAARVLRPGGLLVVSDSVAPEDP